ncbi:MAG: hypothetical protein ACHQZR_04120, partial [Candidatus Limnocylindrales bacterium]
MSDLVPVTPVRSSQRAVQDVLASLPGRSSDPVVCPFLRRVTEDGLLAPGATPAEAHRCAALTAPLAPSLMQQEVMCLVAGHESCPRFRQGTAAIGLGLGIAPSRVRLPGAIQLVVAAAVVILLGAIGLMLLGGGSLLGTSGGAGSTGSQVALASTPGPSPSPAPTTATAAPSPAASGWRRWTALP